MNSADLFRVTFAESDGPLLTTAARNTISEFLETGRREIQPALGSDPRFKQKLGCFVTLKEKDLGKSLRGCIGYPDPVFELSRALTNASIEAATGDPRFPPVKKSELSRLLVEVSVIAQPVQIEVNNPTELPSRIDVGKDGLIMRWSYGSGLLLPQVASEFNWEAEEFLCNLCMKAGAPPDQWLVPGTAIYKFRALVFEEN